MNPISAPQASVATPLTPSEDQLPGIRDLVRGALNHYKLILAFLLLGLLAGSFLASSHRRYATSAVLRIDSGRSDLQLSTTQLLTGTSSESEKITSEMQIMSGRTVYLRVADTLGLARNADFWGRKTAPDVSTSDPHGRDLVVRRMQKVVSVDLIPKSTIVTITATTPSPVLSAKIANAVSNEYISRVFQVHMGSTKRVSSWLMDQLTDLERRVEQDQERLVTLQEKLGVLSTDQRNGAYLVADSLSDVTKASADATIERIVAETRYRALAESDPNLIENSQGLLREQSSGGASLLQSLRDSRAAAASAYAQAAAVYGPRYPDVMQAKARVNELDREVADEEKRIVNQAKMSYSAAASNEQETQSVLTKKKGEAFQARNSMVEFAILQRQYEADKVLYEGLMERLRVADINAGLGTANVDIIEMADVPSLAKTPLPWEWFVLCVVGSLLLGFFVALVVSQLDTRLLSAASAEEKLGIPSLATLQKLPGEPGRKAFPIDENFLYMEEMQLLRSSVMMSRSERAPQVILVTSSVPKEGKSTIARNLAAVMASHGSKVLLMDADLHMGSQQPLAVDKLQKGLSHVISSTTEPMSAVMPVADRPNLYLMATGPRPPQTSTLLGSKRMEDVMQQLRGEFDFIVVDAPPMLGVTDSVLLSRLVDVVFFVIREGAVQANDAKKAMSLINRVSPGKIIGFVLNASTWLGGKYGYSAAYAEYAKVAKQGAKN